MNNHSKTNAGTLLNFSPNWLTHLNSMKQIARKFTLGVFAAVRCFTSMIRRISMKWPISVVRLCVGVWFGCQCHLTRRGQQQPHIKMLNRIQPHLLALLFLNATALLCSAQFVPNVTATASSGLYWVVGAPPVSLTTAAQCGPLTAVASPTPPTQYVMVEAKRLPGSQSAMDGRRKSAFPVGMTPHPGFSSPSPNPKKSPPSPSGISLKKGGRSIKPRSSPTPLTLWATSLLQRIWSMSLDAWPWRPSNCRLR